MMIPVRGTIDPPPSQRQVKLNKLQEIYPSQFANARLKLSGDCQYTVYAFQSLGAPRPLPFSPPSLSASHSADANEQAHVSVWLTLVSPYG